MKVKTILIMIMLMLLLGLTVMVFSLYQKNRIDEDLIYMIQSIPLNQTEEKAKYTKMMVKIFTAYSFRYDKRYKKSMSKEEKIVYLNENYKFAKLLKFGLYDVPILHQLETSFDPYVDHEYGEIGIGGIKWGTALLAQKLLDYMPDNYRRALYFDLKTKQDLKDPIISMKITYTLLWYERRQLRGLESWYISTYHWGSLILKHWKKGKGSVPTTFTLNGITYDVIKYYVSWAELRDSYEMGQIEPSKPIVEKWTAYMKKMKQEEIDYRKCRSVIRKQRKLLKEKNELEIELQKKYTEIDKQMIHIDKELKRIGGIANKTGWRKQYIKLRELIKNYIRRK